MRRRPLRSTLTACTLLIAAAGCSSYRYMRDPTADLETSRREYVENNPGNKYNEDIGSGRVRRGMSRLQVRVTWGDPDLVAPRPPSTEFWSYEENEPAQGVAIYQLRFEGEILAAIDIDRNAANLSSSEERQRGARRDERTIRTESGRKPGPR